MIGDDASTTIAGLIRWGEGVLAARRLPGPRLDAELLLAHLLQRDRAYLHAHPNAGNGPRVVSNFRDAIAARAAGVPLSYLTGVREFYGYSFLVTPAVLVPRPETELLVEWASSWLRMRAESHPAPRIADVGTGSGCIIIALALELADLLPRATFFATEISPDALAISRANAAMHGVSGAIEIRQGDLLGPLSAPLDLVISNPPYVALEDALLHPHVAAHEPAVALRDIHDGDGLGFYRRFIREAPPLLSPDGALLFEVGESQIAAVRAIYERHGYRAESRRDLAGIERALLVSREPVAR